MSAAAKFKTTMAIVITSFALAGCGGIQPNKPVPQEYKEGQAVFHKNCAPCHGPDADGSMKRGPALIQQFYIKENFSDQKMAKTIVEGSDSGAMPSLKSRVTKKEIPEIVKYLRYLQNETFAEDEEDGGLKFAEKNPEGPDMKSTNNENISQKKFSSGG